MFSGPMFVAWLVLWMAARSDPALAEAVVRLDREFMTASEDVLRELFADEIAAAPELGRAGTEVLGLLYSLMSGLGWPGRSPATSLALAEGILTAFKTLVRMAIPVLDGGNHHGSP